MLYDNLDIMRLGCAVYTGVDTKMALNSKLTSNKFSTIEKYRNLLELHSMFR